MDEGGTASVNLVACPQSVSGMHATAVFMVIQEFP